VTVYIYSSARRLASGRENFFDKDRNSLKAAKPRSDADASGRHNAQMLGNPAPTARPVGEVARPMAARSTAECEFFARGAQHSNLYRRFRMS
jgi:hypothetical protein